MTDMLAGFEIVNLVLLGAPVAGFLLLMYFFSRNAKESDEQRWQKYNTKKTNEYHGPPFK